jgi:sodium-coupled neutral amino acid transporter 11
VRCGIKARRLDFELVTEHAFGRPGFYAVSFFMFAFAYGALLAYFVVIGDNVTAVLQHLLGSEYVVSREIVVLVFGICFIFPLCCLRDMSSLSNTSTFSVLSVCMIIVILCVRAPKESLAEHRWERDKVGIEMMDQKFFAGVGAMSFAFVCHHSAFLVHGSLDNPTPKRFAKVLKGSIATSTFLSILLAVVGFLSFLSRTDGDLLQNFPADDEPINVARVLLSMTMVCTYPMEFFVCRSVLQSIFFGGTRLSTAQHYGVTITVFLTTLVLGIYITDLGVVLELTGGFSASFLGFILPGAIFLRTEGLRSLWAKAVQPAKTRREKCYNVRRLLIPVLLLVLGCVFMVTGTSSLAACFIHPAAIIPSCMLAYSCYQPLSYCARVEHLHVAASQILILPLLLGTITPLYSLF